MPPGIQALVQSATVPCNKVVSFVIKDVSAFIYSPITGTSC